MKSIWFDNNEKVISFSFDKELIKDGIKKYNNGAIKGVDSIYQSSISIFGLIIIYGDFNYNRIIHILLNNNDNYTRSKNSHSIKVLKETLLKHMKNNFKNVSTPFNWNCSLNRDTGEIKYYLTGEKKWFEDNHLEELVSGYVEIVGRDNIIKNLKKFPKYNLRNMSVTEYITKEAQD